MISERGRLVLGSLVIGLATLGLMLATEPRLAIVWDEGYTLGREARLREWFRALRDPAEFAAHWTPPALELVQQVGAAPPRPDQIDSRSKLLFDTRVLAYFWPFAREEPHGHPPFYALLGLTGDVLAPSWQDLPRARLGPILALQPHGCDPLPFCGRALGPRGGGCRGLGLGLPAQPLRPWPLRRVRRRADLALGPGDRGVRRGRLPGTRRKVATSAGGSPSSASDWPSGCALATKLTGWFLPIPFLAWAAWVRDRRGVPRARRRPAGRRVRSCFLLNPPWWTEPIAGLSRFFRSNLTRGQDDTDPGAVPRDGLPDAERVPALVQHAGLDRDGHPGRIPAAGIVGNRPGAPPVERPSRSGC